MLNNKIIFTKGYAMRVNDKIIASIIDPDETFVWEVTGSTADLKYHDFFEADNEMLIVDAGHFETEQFTKQLFADIILKKNPKFAVQISRVNTNSVNYFV